MNKVLVTGGAGFIGSHLCLRLIENNYQVIIVDNLSPQIHGDNAGVPAWITDNEIEFIQASITDRTVMEAVLGQCDSLIHLAAETGTGQSMYEIEKYNLVNVQATALILDIITNKKLKPYRVLLASSRSVYGEGAYECVRCDSGQRVYPGMRTSEQLSKGEWTSKCTVCHAELVPIPTKETDKISPASIYAATKYAQEQLISISCESLGIGYGILRLQNVYGEGQSLNNPYTGILSIFSTRIRRNKNLPIFEDGEETRDFVHVEDVVNAFLAALSCDVAPNNVFNVGTGELTTVSRVANELSIAFGESPNLVVTGEYRLGDIRHNRADITRLTGDLGYTPKITLSAGLKRFVEWVKTQPLPEDKLESANKELKSKGLMS